MRVTRLVPSTVGVVSFAVALSIALGQPPPKQPPEPGFTAALSGSAGTSSIINCPPTRPAAGGSDC